MKKATTPFTNDQYEILKKQFIADTLGQIQIVLDDRQENEPLEKINENFNEYLKRFITEDKQRIFRAMLKEALKVDIYHFQKI
ncbi:MAG: hypothetical protein K9I02_07290 [Haliscomenobacter sp.]|nr:hypothetical protein [Haliscomenobacter sp.]